MDKVQKHNLFNTNKTISDNSFQLKHITQSIYSNICAPCPTTSPLFVAIN